MKKYTLTYRNLKHRLTAFTLKHMPDVWGGYQEVWEPHANLWGYVVAHPQGPSHEPGAFKDQADRGVKSHSPLRCQVFIRIRKHFETFQGFERLNKFLRVIERPVVLACQRFVLYRTLLEDKRP